MDFTLCLSINVDNSGQLETTRINNYFTFLLEFMNEKPLATTRTRATIVATRWGH